jgi:hypothetical protein
MATETAKSGNDFTGWVSYVTRVADERINGFRTSLLRSAKATADAIGERILDYRDAVLGECDVITKDNDGKDDDDSVTMPRDLATLLDQLRSRRPAAYSALLEGADRLVEVDVLQRRDRAGAIARDVLMRLQAQAAGSSSVSVGPQVPG